MTAAGVDPSTVHDLLDRERATFRETHPRCVGSHSRSGPTMAVAATKADVDHYVEMYAALVGGIA